MKPLARSHVWRPQLDRDIEDIVKRCNMCQETRNAPNRAPLNPWEMTGKPWSRLHIDFEGPFQGQVFFITDHSHSKLLDVSLVRTTSAAAAIDKLAMLFAANGLPDVVVSDNGAAFTAAEFKTFMNANTIRHVTVAPYHPASNGQAERMVQPMKQALRRVIHGSWSIRLARFLFNQHVNTHTSMGDSPAEMLMSRRPRSSLDNLHPDSCDERRYCLEQDKRNGFINETVRRFSPGDLVYMRNYKSERRSSFLDDENDKTDARLNRDEEKNTKTEPQEDPSQGRKKCTSPSQLPEVDETQADTQDVIAALPGNSEIVT
uniref:Integrase catalytic domain-containing protein n=1 Tax=Trichuris muris TaxID=70415 RepID=A0A5S6R5P2_TRIMR